MSHFFGFIAPSDGNSYANVETACRAGTNPGYFHGRCGDTIDTNERWAIEGP